MFERLGVGEEVPGLLLQRQVAQHMLLWILLQDKVGYALLRAEGCPISLNRDILGIAADVARTIKRCLEFPRLTDFHLGRLIDIAVNRKSRKAIKSISDVRSSDVSICNESQRVEFHKKFNHSIYYDPAMSLN